MGAATGQSANHHLQRTVSDNYRPYDPDAAFELFRGRQAPRIDEVRFGGNIEKGP